MAVMLCVVVVMMLCGNFVEFNLNVLVGYWSFDMIQCCCLMFGWLVMSGGNDFGVGMIGIYGICVVKGWWMMLFVLFDYNCIDMVWYIDVVSFYFYMIDNGDIGMMGMIGVVFLYWFGVEKWFCVLVFGLMVVVISMGVLLCEFGLVGVCLVNVFGNSVVKVVWEEIGFGFDYCLILCV